MRIEFTISELKNDIIILIEIISQDVDLRVGQIYVAKSYEICVIREADYDTLIDCVIPATARNINIMNYKTDGGFYEPFFKRNNFFHLMLLTKTNLK